MRDFLASLASEQFEIEIYINNPNTNPHVCIRVAFCCVSSEPVLTFLRLPLRRLRPELAPPRLEPRLAYPLRLREF